MLACRRVSSVVLDFLSQTLSNIPHIYNLWLDPGMGDASTGPKPLSGEPALVRRKFPRLENKLDTPRQADPF